MEHEVLNLHILEVIGLMGDIPKAMHISHVNITDGLVFLVSVDLVDANNANELVNKIDTIPK